MKKYAMLIALLFTSCFIFSQDFNELVMTGSPEEIEKSISNNKNIEHDLNSINDHGITPLANAAWHNQNPDVITELVKAGADINGETKEYSLPHNMTPLMYAALYNNQSVILRLLELGANTEYQEDKNDNLAYDLVSRNNLVNDNSIKRLLMPIEYLAISANVDEISRALSFNSYYPEELNMALLNAVHYNPSADVIKFLISKGVDITYKAKDKVSILELAQYNSNPEIVKIIVPYWIEKKRIPFYITAWIGSYDEVRDALKNGANYNDSGTRMKSALMYAAQYNNDPRIIKLLINLGAKIDDKDDSDLTAFEYAARYNQNVEVLKVLIASLPSSNDSKYLLNTALIGAAEYSKNEDIISTLVKAGAEVNYRSKDRMVPLYMTPLMAAAYLSEEPRIVKRLIKLGASLEDHDNNRQTPLCYAVKNVFCPTMTKLLIDLGANIKTVDDSGDDPLLLASQDHINKSILYSKMQMELIENYSRDGYSYRIQSISDNDYLKNKISILDYLIQAGCKINIQNKVSGTTPLMNDSEFDYSKDVVEYLLSKGAKINLGDVYGYTSIMYAARRGKSYDVIITLLKAGADPNAKTKPGYEQENAFELIKNNDDLKNTPAYSALNDARFN